MTDRLLKVGDVAERLGVSKPTVYSRIKTGELPAIKRGGCLRVVESALDQYKSGRYNAYNRTIATVLRAAADGMIAEAARLESRL